MKLAKSRSIQTGRAEKPNKIYTKRLQAMIKVKRYVDSCRHTLEKNETCTLVRRDCDKVNAALARAKEYCNDRWRRESWSGN